MTSPKFAASLTWNQARAAIRHRLSGRGCREVSQALKEALEALKEQGLCKEPDNSETWKHVQRTQASTIRESQQMTVAKTDHFLSIVKSPFLVWIFYWSDLWENMGKPFLKSPIHMLFLLVFPCFPVVSLQAV